MLKSWNYLQQEHLKKFKAIMKTVNIDKENIHIF